MRMSRIRLQSIGLVTAIGALVTLATAAPVYAASSLVGYWNFEETSGTTSADVSGTGNSGNFVGSGITISPDVPPTTCYVNERSLHFNGDGSYVNVPDTPSMDPDYISIAFWVKPEVTASQYQHLVFKQRIPGVATSYGVWLDNLGRPYAEFSDGGVSGVAGTTTLPLNQWSYVVVTYDGSNINMYINGALDAHRAYGNGPIQYGGYPLKIGHGDYNYPFQGSIDDLRIYNRALTTQEVADINAGGCGPGVAPADDGDGVAKVVEDAAPNNGDGNNDGIADSTQANVSSFVDPVTGKYVTIALDVACSLTRATSVAPSQAHRDEGFVYSTGLVDFSAHCGTPGYTSTVTLYFYGASSGRVVRKYNSTTGHYATISTASQTRSTIGGQAVTAISYQVTDGGALDADGVANGDIVDPVGLAVPSSTAAVNSSVGELAPTGDSLTLEYVVIATLLAAGTSLAIAYHRRFL